MLQNYFKIALRNLFKNKVFSFINILGLAIGMACCMLILLWVQHELSYDKYHTHADDIYRVGTVFVGQDNESKSTGTPAPLGPALMQEYPEVEAMARLVPPFNSENKDLIQVLRDSAVIASFYEKDGFYVDSSFFKIFTYDFLAGNPETALNQPNTAVLSEEVARNIFGNSANAVGQVFRIKSSNGDTDYRVTGVFRQPEQPSHIKGRFFLSIYTGLIGEFVSSVTNMAGNNFLQTYILLTPGTDPKALEAKFPQFVEKYMSKDLAQAGYAKRQYLKAVPDIHLRSEAEVAGDYIDEGNINYVFILASIALLTLFIACINFMNLTTARSGMRAAEVGIRKVMGAEKQSLIRQFIGESMLLSLIAFVLSIVAVELFLPTFNQLTGKSLSLLSEPLGLLWFLGIALITGLLSGSYPAFYLSSFNPATVLKGKLANNLSAAALRRGLVVFQFVISIVLIVASLFTIQQMDFLQNKSLGFQKDQQVVIPLRSLDSKRNYPALKNELLQHPQVSAATGATSYPGIFPSNDISLYKSGETVKDAKIVRMNYVDYDFLKTLHMELAAGRFFSPDFPADTTRRLVVNEATAKQLGYTSPEEIVGQTLSFNWQGSTDRFEVIGVVRDFHYLSLHEEIRPYALQLFNYRITPPPSYMVANVHTENLGETLAMLEEEWKQVNSNEPFEYSFLDEDFQRNYETEQRISSIIKYFTFIAILISCLGLFGLAAFTAERRTKEIGIRKVLGASVQNIVLLLSKEFVLLIVIAFVIATPIAWYAASRWLETFAYRIDIGWWVFALAGVLALVIALLTISFQSIRAAVHNPVESLRSE